MGRRRFDLTEHEWSIIQPLLPQKLRGVPWADDWRVINGILWRFRTGSAWADIPERYGPHKTCYNRFVRWQKVGHWQAMLDAITGSCDDLVMIDSTMMRVHQHGAIAPPPKKNWAADHGMGRSRGGLTTKLHALVDGAGRPVAMELTPGLVHDSKAALGLMNRLRRGQTFMGDKAYDANAILARCCDADVTANIPPKAYR